LARHSQVDGEHRRPLYELNTVVKEKNNLIGNFDPVKGLQQVGVGGVSSPFNGDHNNLAHGSALRGILSAMAKLWFVVEAASCTSKAALTQ